MTRLDTLRHSWTQFDIITRQLDALRQITTQFEAVKQTNPQLYMWQRGNTSSTTEQGQEAAHKVQ